MSVEDKLWYTHHDMETGNKLALEIGQRVEEKKKNERRRTLGEDEKKEIAESVISEFIKEGILSGSEAEAIAMVKDPKKWKQLNVERDLDRAFDDRRKKALYEANWSEYDRRVPANPMD